MNEFYSKKCRVFEDEEKYCGYHRHRRHHVKVLLQDAKRKKKSVFAYILDKFLIKSSWNQRRLLYIQLNVREEDHRPFLI